MTVASETNRTALTSSGSLGPYSVGYIVISDADLAVYVAGTLKTLTTHYTVANAGTTSNATITFTAGNAPTSGDQIVMVRNVSLLQSYNPANGDAFDSEVLEGTIDRVYHAMQELGDKTDGTIKFSVGLSGSTGYNSDIATAGTITANKAARSNKGLMFDANGDITVTDDNPNEQVTLAEAQVALATTQATNAAGSGTTASEWATKDDGYVSGTGNSSKAWAIGGTYVTDTANRGASKEWAIEDSGTVDGTGHSSKEYAQGTQSGTGGSAKNWAQQTGADVTGGSAGDKSAKSWASETGANAPADGSSKEWATSTTEVAGGLKGAKGYAEDAAASYDSFDDRYLGTKSADPTLDNDGNALLTGALYYNTSASNMRVYSGSAWGVLDTLPQNLGATDTPTFATPTASGHAAIKSYVDANAGDSLPSQAGKSGKFLTTDGSNTSWDDVPVDELFSNIALLGFKVAAQHSLAKYNLVDQTIDEFVDATGVDTTASTNETLTSGYYKVSPGTAGTVRKTYTGSDISYSVPSNVSTMTVELWGAGGGCGTGTTGSGGGGYAKGDLAVTAGETLTLIIGQGGRTAGVYSGSGGGGTFIYRGSTGTHSNILAAAGGGGGAIGGAHGGGGGGTTGGDSVNSNGTPSTGGSQSGVGAVGSTGSTGSSGGSVTQTNASGTNGGSITCASGTNTTTAYGGGGAGTSDNANWSAAGGGGGYYGGGSGGPLNSISAGAGGSGYVGGLTGTTTLTRGEESSSTNASGGSSSANHSTGIGSGGDNGAGGNGEMYFTYNEDSPAMTLVSQATTAQATPTSADIVMLYSNGAGTATLNTDLTAEVSRDGGTTWTSATLASQGTTGGHTIVTAHGVDISSQPSGTSMKWRVKTLNQSGSRETRIQAVSMGWA